MSTEVMLWSVAAIIVVILCICGVKYIFRKERKEEQQKEQLKNKIRDILKDCSFNVVIRKHDGGKTYFESMFIGALANCKAKVFVLNDDDASSVLKGELDIVPKGKKMIVGRVKISTTIGDNSFDCRLIEEGGKILFADSRSNWFDSEINAVIMDMIQEIALSLDHS